MFSFTEEFARAQFDYTRARLTGHAKPRVDPLATPRHRSFVAALVRHRRLRPSIRHG